MIKNLSHDIWGYIIKNQKWVGYNQKSLSLSLSLSIAMGRALGEGRYCEEFIAVFPDLTRSPARSPHVSTFSPQSKDAACDSALCIACTTLNVGRTGKERRKVRREFDVVAYEHNDDNNGSTRMTIMIWLSIMMFNDSNSKSMQKYQQR